MGEDYTEPFPLEVTFPSGDGVGGTACATLYFVIINDNNLDFNREFVNLSSVAPTGPFILLSSSSSTVTVQVDDGMQYVILTFSSIWLFHLQCM